MGIPIARIVGIEIRVQLGWVIVLALVAVIAVGQLTAVDPELEGLTSWVLGGIVSLGFFLSSVLHDLAHAIVARRRGIDVKAIAVSFFGGATPLDPSAPDPGDDAAIAASGPIASIALGVVLFALTVGAIALGDSFSAAAGVLSVLVFLNLVLGFVNLVPAYPLDGGRIVRDLAWRRSGSERSGWRAASWSGRLTGMVVIALGVAVLVADGTATGAMIAITGWFLVLSANAVRDRIRLDELVGDQSVGDAMDPATATINPGLTLDTFASQLLDGQSQLAAVPVVQGDEVVGIVGAGQIRRMPARTRASTRVEEVMIRPPRLTLLTPAEPLKLALERLQRGGLDGLPVVDDGKLVGVLTRSGAAIHLQGLSKAAGAEPGTSERPEGLRDKADGAPTDGSQEGEGPAT